MEQHIPALIAIIILIFLSAFFSASETAFSSLNQIRVKNAAEDGSKRAKLVLKLADRYDTLLSAILVGNNIVNITLTSIATVICISLFAENGATISTVITTLAVLIFGEISPKMLAKAAPERFAFAVAPAIQLMVWILTPVNFLFNLWRKLLGMIFRIKEEPAYTEEDLLTIVEEAAQDGGIDDEESELIRSAIEFNDLEAIDIFTPRVKITGVDRDDSTEEVEKVFVESGFSRLPVYDDSLDNIVGILNQKDFYNMTVNGGGAWQSLITPPVFITRSSKVNDVLRLFQSTKSHMAVIADEYGGTVGIVTMEDILEELVGEIYDEHDEVVQEIAQLSENTWRILCSTDLDKMLELFEMDEDPESTATSVGGWVLEQFSQIPAQGDTFTYGRLSVLVSKTDMRRVLEIDVTLLAEEEEDGKEKDKEKDKDKDKKKDKDRDSDERLR